VATAPRKEQRTSTATHAVATNDLLNSLPRTMEMHEFTEERFLKDVATHEMTILKEDGIYRHVRFKRPDSSSYRFDLITWPGFLCYCGDMGTYVFSRLQDMFEFFRTDRHCNKKSQLYINPGYWSEKVQSDSRYGNGTECFSEDLFKEALRHDFDAFFECQEPDDDASDKEKAEFVDRKEKLWIEVEDQILSVDSLEHEGLRAALDFDSDGLQFVDFWDHNFKEHSFHFMWCCYAMAWGIAAYDKAKESTAV
jgi:hypothetical protein